MDELKEKEWANARLAKARAEQRLLKLPGVTGVDVGYKEVGGRATEVVAIRVFVAKKQDVPTDRLIPKQIENVPTDVIERRFELHSQQA